MEHPCYITAQQLDNDILVQRRSELIQVFLEIQKVNANGIDLYKCFTDYTDYQPIPSRGKEKPKKESDNPQSWRSHNVNQSV